MCEPYKDGSDYAFRSRDGQELHLGRLHVAERGPNSMGIYFVVDDVHVFYDEVVAGGVEPLSAPEDKPWRMLEFAVSDPDGTLLRFGSRSRG